MFQFRRFPTYAYLIQRRLTEYCSAGFPHSVIPGSKCMCHSPRLIAACHDLLRLLMPRHSPCALISLTSSGQSPLAPFPPPAFGFRRKASLSPLPLLSNSNPLCVFELVLKGLGLRPCSLVEQPFSCSQDHEELCRLHRSVIN